VLWQHVCNINYTVYCQNNIVRMSKYSNINWIFIYIYIAKLFVYKNSINITLFWHSYYIILTVYLISGGTAVAQWLRCCVTNRKDAGSIAAGVSELFIDIKSFRSHYGSGVDLASNRNEYQEYFLRIKTAGA